MAAIRLQKVLARAGVASRRAAEAMIAAGRVRVDGHVVTEMGTKVEARAARVEVDGTRIVREEPIYIVLHKPRGVVSTMSDPEGRPSVRDLLKEAHARVFPVGRLDFNTSGVLLATNDGEFSDALLHPRRIVPKTYVVKVQGVMTPSDVDTWRYGVDLEDGKTKPAKVKLLRHEGDKTWLELTITEGRNQQVRRMGDATRFRVMRLARIAFAGINSEALAPGRWRYLTGDELKELKKEYGVPKRIVAPPMPPKAREKREPFRTTPSRAVVASAEAGRAREEARERANTRGSGHGNARARAGGRERGNAREDVRGGRNVRGREKVGAPVRGREEARGRRNERGPEGGRGNVRGREDVRGRGNVGGPEVGRAREDTRGRGNARGPEASRGRQEGRPIEAGRGREDARGRGNVRAPEIGRGRDDAREDTRGRGRTGGGARGRPSGNRAR